MLHMYDALLTMNEPDLLFKWCTHERYEALAHRRTRLDLMVTLAIICVLSKTLV
jgi:hypothetical protein